MTIGRQRLSRWSSCRWAPPASVCRCARPSPVSGHPAIESVGANATQESTLGLIFHWADQKGFRCWT
ncbi:conserved ATP-binding domain protein [Mycobacterium xenopi 4042]|uniref:Conserved ATP-binding domain protein n=1 Tax=Mycobacterium xenopi 4042 TaxID=1299334 RepID=X7YX43_MYCXE|nr:conserved ATP-binding domain protein [Mycobacterium xenopi 4042]